MADWTDGLAGVFGLPPLEEQAYKQAGLLGADDSGMKSQLVNQGLLNFGTAMMASAGPSRMPVRLGSAIASGFSNAQQQAPNVLDRLLKLKMFPLQLQKQTAEVAKLNRDATGLKPGWVIGADGQPQPIGDETLDYQSKLAKVKNLPPQTPWLNYDENGNPTGINPIAYQGEMGLKMAGRNIMNTSVTNMAEGALNKWLGELGADRVKTWNGDAAAATNIVQSLNHAKDLLAAGARTGYGTENLAKIGSAMRTAGFDPATVEKLTGVKSGTDLRSTLNSVVFDLMNGKLAQQGFTDEDARRVAAIGGDPNIAPPDALAQILDRVQAKYAQKIEKYHQGLDYLNANGAKNPYAPLQFEDQWNQKYGVIQQPAQQPAGAAPAPNAAPAQTGQPVVNMVWKNGKLVPAGQ